jgi:hypothetical protein
VSDRRRLASIGVLLLTAALLLAGCGAQSPDPPSVPAPTSSPGAVAPKAGQTPTQPPTQGPTQTPTPTPSAAVPLDARTPGCPPATVLVAGTPALQSALRNARPGDVIALQPGTYPGNFVATAAGTPEQPIFVCGGADAVLDGGGIQEGEVVRLDGARYWRLVGFGIRNGRKGILAEGTVGSEFRSLAISGVGDEAVILRRTSTDNLVTGVTIRSTGLRRPQSGEGIYVGTSSANWCLITACNPDGSDRNALVGNDIAGTTAESIDVREGTSDGILRGNRFDGFGMTAAESWVDIKGNGWLIDENAGVNSPKNGFETHEAVVGWGRSNTFRNNIADVNGPGRGFSIQSSRGNVFECNNEATRAAGGTSSLFCR